MLCKQCNASNFALGEGRSVGVTVIVTDSYQFQLVLIKHWILSHIAVLTNH